MVYKLMITGHRDVLANSFYSQLKRFLDIMHRKHNDLELITGMAMGADQAFAWYGINANPRIPVHAYIPYYSQSAHWSLPQKKEYYRLLERCNSVRVINLGECFEDAAKVTRMIRSNQYLIPHHEWLVKHPTKALMERNKAMAEDCDEAVAIFSPLRVISGTAATIKMLKKLGKTVTEIEPII